MVSLAGFPDGYDPASAGPWQVDLTTPGQVQNVGFVFARWTPPGEGTIAVRARHVDAGNPVAGVTSSVRSCVDDVPYGYLTTDMNGNASAQFPLGCYVVETTTIPADTALVYGGPFTAELDAPGVVRTAEFTLNFSLPPEPPVPTAHGRIVKMDRISGEPLEGAIFVVGPCQSEWSHREVSGPDGHIPLALVPGCYVAKEIAAPDGYIADTRPITFYATENDFFTVQALNMPEQQGRSSAILRCASPSARFLPGRWKGTEMRSRTVIAALAGVALLLAGGCAEATESVADSAPRSTPQNRASTTCHLRSW